MTITELITSLQEIPQHRRDEEIQIYVDGDISGFLEIAAVEENEEVGGYFSYISTKTMRQPRGE